MCLRVFGCGNVHLTSINSFLCVFIRRERIFICSLCFALALTHSAFRFGWIFLDLAAVFLFVRFCAGLSYLGHVSQHFQLKAILQIIAYVLRICWQFFVFLFVCFSQCLPVSLCALLLFIISPYSFSSRSKFMVHFVLHWNSFIVIGGIIVVVGRCCIVLLKLDWSIRTKIQLQFWLSEIMCTPKISCDDMNVYLSHFYALQVGNFFSTLLFCSLALIFN